MNDTFHPLVQRWFTRKFGKPTEVQTLAWPGIARGENSLIAAPTGSGKTLAAFLVCIDRLARTAVKDGELPDECKVLYLSPLKALASDIRKNLEIPLAEIQEVFAEDGVELPKIRSHVRTGDTPSHERQKITKKPPHILVTTPESLYLMLTSEGGRKVLKTVETVIVDEIHAIARDKRGSHMALSLERLKGLLEKPPTMIGLSATQKPLDEIARFLIGARETKPCKIIDVGHTRELDLGIITPASALSTVASHEQWEEIYQILGEEIKKHRSTVLFVNTRRLSERVAFRLAEILGDDAVVCHHGSMSKERRLTAETLLKEGKLKAIVATASLELGIDIGYIDLVCNIGIPFSIASFLQRIGRSGHAIHATPKGRIVPLTRDELLESLALLRSVREGNLDRIEMPIAPVDILTQHLIAECAGRGPEAVFTVDEAFQLFTGAWPFRNISKADFLKIVEMAAEGYSSGRRRFAYLIWDRLRDRLSVKAGARLVATTSGGSIPEMGDYRVVLGEDGTMVGTVNEDFAIESIAGDIFSLGTHSWRVRHVRGGEVVVDDAEGQPPTMPFWLGEAPGRTQEFSEAVSKLREDLAERLTEDVIGDAHLLQLEALTQVKELPKTSLDPVRDWLGEMTGVQNPWPLLQATHYVAVQKAALGSLPSRKNIIFERFFDEVGGMQLVIHSCYGARINRAWGLALRKRFCRTFDFELQASADDDGVVLSLAPQQSFPTEQLFKMLNEENVEHFLTQALLAAPMFGVRWRWNATRALAVLRQVNGKRIAPALQRFRSEDLLSAVFPAQTACQENTPGDIEIPHHPLVQQTVYDCLTEAMDIAGLKRLFHEIEAGRVTLTAKDTREPSPFAYQLLNAYPYAFLDDAALEDRRTRSVAMRPALSVHDLENLDRLDPKAIQQVTGEAWPEPRSTDEWYEILVSTPAFPAQKAKDFQILQQTLIAEGRATVAEVWQGGKSRRFFVAAESIPVLKGAFKEVQWSPEIALPESLQKEIPSEEARQAILKGWLEISGPVSEPELEELFGLENLGNHLAAIEATGVLVRCKLEKDSPVYTHWCSRGLLRRIHRLTVEGLREQIRPVTPEDYLEFILEEHGLNLAGERGDAEELFSILERLEGFEAPALAWESEIFASRMPAYQTSMLDELTASGSVSFGRLTPKKKAKDAVGARNQKLTSTMPLAFILRRDWSWIAVRDEAEESETILSSDAQQVEEALRQGGAQFIDELEESTRLLETQLENALGELLAEGKVTCDHFHAFRALLNPLKKQKQRSMGALSRRFGQRKVKASTGGRWTLLRKRTLDPSARETRLEEWAWLLLARYGVVFRDLLERESLAPSWGELVRTFRQLEARGEVRGGRFIAGVGGEQFSLTETFEKLRRVREERNQGLRKGSFAVISSADPLNLVGVITKNEKVSVSPHTRLLFEAGELAAVCRGEEIETVRKVNEDKLRSLRLVGTFRAKARAL